MHFRHACREQAGQFIRARELLLKSSQQIVQFLDNDEVIIMCVCYAYSRMDFIQINFMLLYIYIYIYMASSAAAAAGGAAGAGGGGGGGGSSQNPWANGPGYYIYINCIYMLIPIFIRNNG